MKKIIAVLFTGFYFFSFLHSQNLTQIDESQKDLLPELISEEELEPFFIDEEETHLILELFDKENQYRTITKAGGITVPDSEYAQGMIRKYTAQYMTKSGSNHLFRILDNGEEYRAFVRLKLMEMKMPPALEYLPVVESEYKINAKSKSGALGMWQFMENSIYPFMKKNEWLDERLDPWKSTDAALKKLSDNFKVYGDWPLAIAAYNCGVGAMNKVLSQVKDKKDRNFWYIAETGLLRVESVNYIPKLLAITALAEHPERYEIFIPEINEKARHNEFDYLQVDDSTSLEWLSMELRLDDSELKRLNNSLIKNVTPPETKYNIRLPSGLLNSAEEALEKP